MNATRILWGQVLTVCSIALAFIWAATQWTAGQLGYQTQLGHPWFMVGHYPVYHPPAFFWWWFAYDAYAPQVFEKGAYIAAAGGLASVVVAITMSVWRAREAKHADTYGSARWATEKEVSAAGLLGPDGLLLGQLGRAYVRHEGPEHVLCFAPTRSGKGVGLVVPTLLTWPGSVIVHDIKGENHGLTAGWRARFSRIVLFDPTNPESDAYSPLLEVRRGPNEVRDVQNVADILVDPEGALEKRNHWEKTSHALLVGAILHVLYAEADKTLAGVASFLSDPKHPIETTLRAMLTTPHLGKTGPHPVIASAARELLNKSENERSGVLSTAMSFLGLYRDPVVAQVTRRCDWRIRDLVDGATPVTLYLVVPPSDISRTKPLVRLILNQVGRRLTEAVYDSPTGKILLIPQGARLIGQYDAQVAFGQSRALLVWNRIVMPNGRSVVLERQPGADAEGYAGLQDQIDNHWGTLFKAALLSTILSVGSEAGTSNDENNLVDAIRRGASDSISQTGRQVVGRSLQVQPTITVRPGFPVRVIVTRDIVMEPYAG